MADRFERLTNLLATLLDTRRPLSLDELLDLVPGYPPDPDSARRQFERDKDTLRGIGVPIELEEDRHSETVGYRVRPGDYELPPLDLTPEETAALHVAVQAMRLEGGEGREALWKLGGADAPDVPPLAALPNVPALPALVEASRTRARVTFRHRGKERHLDPYAVVFRGGNWYAVGQDADREAIRSYRADRIEGEVVLGPPGSFERPEDFDADAALHDEPWRYGDDEPVGARVAVDAVVTPWVLRRLGLDASAVETTADGNTVVPLTVTNREAFRTFVLSLLDHAVVLEPEELRADVVGWLRAIAGAGGHDEAEQVPAR